MVRPNVIHPTAFLDDRVTMGAGNIIGPFAVILAPTAIGDDNWLGPNVAIGGPGESRGGPHPPYSELQGVGVVIGDRNTIREFVTVQQGTATPTKIGDDCYLMARSHLPHEAELEDEATLACAAQIGGHGWVGRGANVGLGAQVLQRSCIGAYAMIGMNATVTRDVPPFALAKGTPATVTGVNRVGLRRRGVADDVIERLDARYREGNLDAPEWLEPSLRVEFDRFKEHQDRQQAANG